MPVDLTDRVVVESLIRQRHFGFGQSIREIERELGLGKTTLSAWCKRHGIAVRSRLAQVSISNRAPAAVAKRSGTKHWAWGIRRVDRVEPMRTNNPIHMTGVAEAVSRGRAAHMRRNPTPSEARAVELFPGCSPQLAIGKYAVDLAFPKAMVILEVDGRNHWAKRRRANDIVRDAWLISQGWSVVRVADNHVMRNPAHLVDVLKAMVPGLQVSSYAPRERIHGRLYEYRVLVRDAQDPTGRKV